MEIASAEKCAVSVLARLTYSFKPFREITVICGDFSQLLSLSFCVIRDSHFLEGSKTWRAIHSPPPPWLRFCSPQKVNGLQAEQVAEAVATSARDRRVTRWKGR